MFVFGSNEIGRHGKGAAKYAVTYCGAQYGCGFGRQGMAYAIPTKDGSLKPLSLVHIQRYVSMFLCEAESDRQQQFFVTRVGCGFAGYADFQIAPMFAHAPLNCILPRSWQAYINP